MTASEAWTGWQPDVLEVEKCLAWPVAHDSLSSGNSVSHSLPAVEDRPHSVICEECDFSMSQEGPPGIRLCCLFGHVSLVLEKAWTSEKTGIQIPTLQAVCLRKLTDLSEPNIWKIGVLIHTSAAALQGQNTYSCLAPCVAHTQEILSYFLFLPFLPQNTACFSHFLMLTKQKIF